MKTFEELYREILNRKISLKAPLPPEYHPYHLDCLLHPQSHAPVVFNEPCEECEYERACQNSCIFDAIEVGEDGKLFINPDLCTGCEACIEACKTDKITAGRDVLPAMKAVRESEGPVYMMVARRPFWDSFRREPHSGKAADRFSGPGFHGNGGSRSLCGYPDLKRSAGV